MNTATDTTNNTTTTTGTETAQSSSSTTDTTASTGEQQTTEAQTSQSEAAPWQDSLPDDLKTHPLFRGYKSADDAMKAHLNLYKQRGVPAERLLTVPEKPQDQSPEDWAPIHKALGVPDDPKDYKIELAAEAAADTPELANVLRELGGKAKFQPAQMNAVIETLNTLGAKAAEADAKALDAETKATTDALNKEWGAAAEGNRRGIGKLIREGIEASLTDIKDPAAKAAAAEQAAADLETKLGSNLTLSRILAYALGKMAEPGAPEGGAANGGGERPLTPSGATAALNALYGDKEKMKALNDRSHPQHGAVLEERRKLLAQQSAGSRPDATA